MSNNRNTLSSNNLPEPIHATLNSKKASVNLSKPEALFQEAAKIAMLGPTVAFCLQPFEIAVHIALTKPFTTLNNLPFPLFAIITSTITATARSYPGAIPGATIKNGILVQRHRFEEKDEHSSEIKEIELLEKEQTISHSDKFKGAMTLGCIDATLTQYHCNKNTYKIREQLTKQMPQPFILPSPQTFYQYFQVFINGLPIRSLKNVSTVNLYMTLVEINNYFKNFFPESNYVNMPTLISTALVGGIAGLTNSVYDNLYLNQAIKINNGTFKAPSVYATFRALTANRNYQVLFSGLSYSIIRSTCAFTLVPKIEKQIEKVITSDTFQAGSSRLFLESRKLLSAAKNTVFFKSIITKMKKSITREEENKLHQRRSTLNPFS